MWSELAENPSEPGLDVRCGEETRVVPRLLQMRSHWMKSQKESLRLEEAGKLDIETTHFLKIVILSIFFKEKIQKKNIIINQSIIQGCTMYIIHI